LTINLTDNEHDYIKVVHRSLEDGGKGKPAALNHGLKHVKGEIVCCFDADYYPQREVVVEKES